MTFKEQNPIYIQIAERICDEILHGQYPEGERLPSVREYAMQVPYGVIQTQGNRLTSIEEKPIRKDFVNGGVYALAPQAFEVMLSEVGRGKCLTMPELFTLLMERDMNTAAYVINEYWLDIGRPEDLKRAEAEYAEVFT